MPGGDMKKLILSIGGATVVVLTMAATVFAGGPMGGQGPAAGGAVVGDVLGLTQDQIRDLRQDGLSLAQIAERQKVDAQKVVDALVARWTERIQARVDAGALTTDEAAQLRTQVQTRATDMVQKTTLGGMQGAAVGAGPRGGGARMGSGAGTGTCDGTGAGYRGGRS
jgi:hypothetical protein